ncbi:MAG: M48 family metallopeptidase [Gammaproteobacteria bacterium]|nr:M48 family metallopeptidase [Gammaproteobacteria bacterium]
MLTDDLHTLDGLPAYTVRESVRAKHVRIKVSAQEGVVAVVPENFDRRHLPGLLWHRRKWIWQSLHHVQTQQQRFERESALPGQIELRAINEQWRVEYAPGTGKSAGARVRGNRQLSVSTNGDERASKQALCRWLARQAHAHLAPWLRELSKTNKLPYGKTVVRGQKTRWGSCSHHKTININYKLLFFPPRLVRYVFLHELCHTIHLNHSHRFWALVARFEPDYKALDAELKQAQDYVPGWVE